MRRKTIKSSWFMTIVMIFFGLSLSISTNAIADCPDGGSPRQEELGKLLLKDKYSVISCAYLGQPYSWMGNQAHPGIDYPASPGTEIFAPISGEYKLSGTEVLGKASYIILPNGKKLFLLHMKNLILGYRNKGEKIGEINIDHVHAELRVNYSGKHLVAGKSCGTECTFNQIEEKTDDPSEVVIKNSALPAADQHMYPKTDKKPPAATAIDKDFKLFMKNFRKAVQINDRAAIRNMMSTQFQWACDPLTTREQALKNMDQVQEWKTLKSVLTKEPVTFEDSTCNKGECYGVFHQEIPVGFIFKKVSGQWKWVEFRAD